MELQTKPISRRNRVEGITAELFCARPTLWVEKWIYYEFLKKIIGPSWKETFCRLYVTFDPKYSDYDLKRGE